MLKRRAANGYWSREKECEENLKKSKKGTSEKKSRFCCTGSNDDDFVVDSGKNNFNLELRNCNLRSSDRLSTCDDYATNSLYGTIDRLIVKKSVSLSTNTNMNNNCATILYTNNYNSLTKDPKLRTSTSYMVNPDDDILDRNEIHF